MGARGSEWSKWDLHVHTPESLVHNYGGADPWEDFLLDLEALPPEFKVIGINDYIFLDGYRRVVHEKANGRIPNIELIIPVIELRIPQFGGTASKWSRVNLHVLFDPALTADQIESYFLSALRREYQLSEEARSEDIQWDAFPEKQSLIELGEKIIAAVPPERRHEFRSPLIEGFNNLNISLESVVDALSHGSLRGKSLLAIGKTEWADVKWQDSNIAEKKNTISRADFVFIATETPADAIKARDSLKAANVNSRLLDCSDAHELSSGTTKDRLGQCATWIKAELTFRGLKYARLEYENRVYLGDQPPVIARVAQAPGRFIESIRIQPTAGCPTDKRWFESEVPLNPEMVCVIGNKGSGKSAFVDIIGLAGNSKNERSFSFLTPDRFRRKPTNPSRWFEVELLWHDGRRTIKNLSGAVDAAKNEEVRYLPQSYLEGICNEVPGLVEGKLDRELKRIIFECLPIENRLGASNLDALIDELSVEYLGRFDAARKELTELNRKVIEWEAFEVPSKKAALLEIQEQQVRQVESHEASQPEIVVSPEADEGVSAHVSGISSQLATVQEQIAEVNAKHQANITLIGRLESQLHVLRKIKARAQDVVSYVGRARDDISADLQAVGLALNVESLLRLESAQGEVDGVYASLREKLAEASADGDDSNTGSTARRLKDLEARARELTAQMSEPLRKYVQYQQQLQQWLKVKDQLVGNEKIEGSLVWVKSQLAKIDQASNVLSQLYSDRKERIVVVANLLRDLGGDLKQLYGPAEKSLRSQSSEAAVIPISFSVQLEARPFAEQFLEFIHLGMRSSFQGQEQAELLVRDMVAETNFNDPESTSGFVSKILEHTRSAQAADGSLARIDVSSILKGGRSVQQLYDFVCHLAYVTPVFHLLFEDKDISMLSPGQRGMVLLLFYLLVDPESIPLLVDQPEENLDNQTVASYLTSAFRAARSRRQVVVVTHNANVAVVCDADQIVRCLRDEQDRFIYSSSPLERLDAIDPILNVLEGTREAFEARGLKYKK